MEIPVTYDLNLIKSDGSKEELAYGLSRGELASYLLSFADEMGGFYLNSYTKSMSANFDAKTPQEFQDFVYNLEWLQTPHTLDFEGSPLVISETEF